MLRPRAQEALTGPYGDYSQSPLIAVENGFSYKTLCSSSYTIKELTRGFLSGTDVCQILEAILLPHLDGRINCPHVSVNLRPFSSPDGIFDMSRPFSSILKEDGFVHVRVYYDPDQCTNHSWADKNTCGKFACISQSTGLTNNILQEVYDSHSNVVIRLPFPAKGKWGDVSTDHLLSYVDIELSRCIMILNQNVIVAKQAIICDPPYKKDEGLRQILTEKGNRSFDKTGNLGLKSPVIYDGITAVRHVLDHGDPTHGAFCRRAQVPPGGLKREGSEPPAYSKYQSKEEYELKMSSIQDARNFTSSWQGNTYGYLILSRGIGLTTVMAIDRGTLNLLRWLLITPNECDHRTCDHYK